MDLPHRSATGQRQTRYKGVVTRPHLGLIACTSFGLLVGCPVVVDTPESTGQAYMSAVAAGNAGKVWLSLDGERRRLHSTAEIAARLDLMSAEQRAWAQKQGTTPQAFHHRASWTDDNGGLTLVEQPAGRWRVTGTLPGFDRVDTPRHALRTFGRAFRARDWHRLLLLVPQAEADAVSGQTLADAFQDATFRAEITKALNALKNAGPGVREGERWTLRSGRHRVVLMLEGAAWKLTDLR